VITHEAALTHADSANDLRLMIKLASDDRVGDLEKAAAGLSLERSDKDLNVLR
jgi:twitching motility protein PilU